MSDKIERFVGDYAFLSNFFPSTIIVGGRKYATVEHAYQAFKTSEDSEHETVRNAPTPAIAKKLGRSVTLREEMKSDVGRIKLMQKLVRLKFENPILRELLLATDNAELIEGNLWNDKFWGVCRGTGENWLGKILMEVRNEIIEENNGVKLVDKMVD